MQENVRKGEELDLDNLLPWLSEQLPELTGEPEIYQFSGGASNWTYQLKFNNKVIILRRAPKGTKAKGAHDMVREFNIQKLLKPYFPYVPNMIAVCENSEILGTEFYIMEKLEGVIPRKNFPRDISWSKEEINNLCYSFWDKLIKLHQIDYEKAGLGSFSKGSGYIERQITGWSKRYTNATTWNVLSGKRVMRWLEKNIPANEQLCLIHNDYRLDNVVINPKNPEDILGILDWELAGIGDPLMDLGNSMAYWVEETDNFFIKSLRRQPTHLPGMLTRKEIIAYYSQQTGIPIDDFRFYRVYGLFRLAGIVQQIYYRYAKGQSSNKAFKNFWMASNYFILTCERIIRRG